MIIITIAAKYANIGDLSVQYSHLVLLVINWIELEWFSLLLNKISYCVVL